MPIRPDDQPEERLNDALDPAEKAEQERLKRIHDLPAIADDDRNTGPQSDDSYAGSGAPQTSDAQERPTAQPKSLTPDQVGKDEAAADDGASSENDGRLPFRQEKGKPGFKITRRQSFAGGIIGLLVGGGIFGSLILTGPFQLIHLSQILSHNFSKSESDSDNRTTHFLRDARAWREKDIRYTRIGGIASRIMNNALDQLEAKGITVTGSDINGHPTTIELDHDKIKNSFPETKGMTPTQIDEWAGEQMGTDSFKDGKLDIGGLKGQAIGKLLSNTSVKFLGDNKAVATLKARIMKKFFGLGSLFHPFSRALNNAISKAQDNAAKKRNEKQPAESDSAAAEGAVEDAEGKLVAPVEEPGVKAFDEFQAEHTGWSDKIVKGAGGAAGFAWATGCTLKDSGKVITAINRKLIVDPSIVEAATLVAGGSQTQNSNAQGGGDLTTQQVGATLDSISGIWAAPGMQALNGEKGGTLNQQDSATWDRDSAAFSDQSFGQDLENIGTTILSYVGLNQTAGGLSKVTLGLFPSNPCSLVYGVAVVGIGLLQNGAAVASCAAGCEGAALSQGVKQLVVYLVHSAESFALSSAAIGTVEKQLVNSNVAPKLAKDAFKGPLGGQLISAGAREFAGTVARGAGGIVVAGSVTKTLLGSAGEEDQQQFRSESYASRLFNTDDYRSLTGQISMMLNPSAQEDFSSVINGLPNIGSSLGNVFSSLLPGASADSTSDSWTGNYNWGTPQYGIPDSMLNDPNLSDPYQNSEDVGQWLSENCTDGNGNIGPDQGACAGTYSDDHSKGITDRIKKCFGNDLTYADNLWDVTPASNTDIDPNSPDYINADCADIQDAQVATNNHSSNATVATAQCAPSKQPQIKLASYTVSQQPSCNKITTADASTGNSTSMWTRTVMFVNDTNTIKAQDCLVGGGDTSDQSCTDEGLTDSSDAPSTPAPQQDNSLPVAGDTGNATQVITVQAPSESSTTAQLETWTKGSDGTWTSTGTPIDAAIAANLGDTGMTTNTKEGLDSTPEGDFTLTQAFGAQADPASGSGLPYHQTGPNDWWDENPSSPTYNKLVTQKNSPGGASEHLATTLPYYNNAVVIDANTANAPGGTVPGNGSGFFLHVQKSANDPTQGCISIPQNQLASIMKWLKPGSNPRILIGLPSMNNTTASTGKPTIVLDPGHSLATDGKSGETGHTDPKSGLNDGDYENEPEMRDAFDVATLVKQKLAANGYTVILTKETVDQKVPWLYSDEDGNSAGRVGLDQADKRTYANVS